jgi:hypothetical protein
LISPFLNLGDAVFSADSAITQSVDHLVLPVSGLESTRDRLVSLGFTVAADARHPFGTENACVFFSDGTYLEPLAIGDKAVYKSSIDATNSFTRRDQLFRAARGAEGFSAIVAKTSDAVSDHARFEARHMSAGSMLQFSRPMKKPDGTTGEGRFLLSFAAEARMRAFFLFSCQRLVALPVDRSALEKHSNGVSGIGTIILSAKRPADYAELITAVFGKPPQLLADGVTFETRNARITILTTEVAQALPGMEDVVIPHELYGAGIVYTVADLAVTEALLAANGVASTRTGGRITVAPASGQGAFFAFEE